MVATRRRRSDSSSSDSENGSSITKTVVQLPSSSHYEQIREQRMKENAERMQKLGLLNLSLKLKKPQRTIVKKIASPTNEPERRSSRIMTLPPVDYRFQLPKAEHQGNSSSKKKKEVVIYIAQGTKPEVYTQEHEKLLGDCETDWELFVDGYDEDGDRIYDPTKGEKCHQCRRTTISQMTSCNKCELPQGMLCGDCLYTRYGENVTEADFNLKWTCPSCRGICNCNICRRKNGWMPTGNIYNKVTKLGFKSVAHYLIKTRRLVKNMEGSDAENDVSQEMPEASPDSTLTGPIRTRRSSRS
ncbi:uncharacterized protein LOC131614880 [Vicia villosa]|uniref:uncharacterized protein LOC131614880 n=1 Tax=Vicia villosa TaxID=3911 RepID=UPI00273C3F48|nr:uncharacterized protein LOC131614880 [Vicia villosa]